MPNAADSHLRYQRGSEHEDPGSITIEVEVGNFYPSIASGLSIAVYEATQAFVHVLVTHAFLRSLATLELAVSKVGKLRPDDDRTFRPGLAPPRTRTAGRSTHVA